MVFRVSILVFGIAVVLYSVIAAAMSGLWLKVLDGGAFAAPFIAFAIWLDRRPRHGPPHRAVIFLSLLFGIVCVAVGGLCTASVAGPAIGSVLTMNARHGHADYLGLMIAVVSVATLATGIIVVSRSRAMLKKPDVPPRDAPPHDAPPPGAPPPDAP